MIIEEKRNNPALYTVRIIMALVITAAIIWSISLCFLPPTAKDALIHHLAIPKIWLNAGGFMETPWAAFSYYPMNLDLLYLIPLAVGADWGANFIHYAFGLATALLVFIYLRSRMDTDWALAGVIVLITTPLIMRLSVSAYVDLGLMFFVTSAVISLIYWRDTGSFRFFLLSALALGLAMGTKYNGLLGLPLLGAAVAIIRGRTKGGTIKPILWACVYIGIALLIFSPWAVKNAMLTGNPVYPLFNSLFDLPGTAPAGQKISIFNQRHFLYGESLWEILLIPVRVFFQGQDNSAQYFDGVLNPILVIIPFFAVITTREKDVRPLALFALIWILMVFFKYNLRARYIVPIIPVLAILTVFGLREILRLLRARLPAFPSTVIVAVIVLGFLIPNFLYAANFWSLRDPMPYLAGKMSREGYLYKNLAQYPVMDYINKNLNPKARVLFLFVGSRGYYCDRDYFYHTYYSGEILKPVINSAVSGKEIALKLKKLGATHIMTRDALLIEFLNNQYSENELKHWREFTSRGIKGLYNARGYSVYRIR